MTGDVLEFGSRSGSWFALILFAGMFGALGWAIARAIRIRTQGRRTPLGRTIGALVFAVPLSFIHASALSGFYELEFHGKTLRLHYLFPGVISETPLPHSSAKIVSTYKGRARLVLSTDYGVFESTPWYRDRVNESLDRFNRRLASIE
jgi:hypothetical protein